MKSYNVKITEENKKFKSFTVKVESEEDFVKWVELLSSFEKQEEISFEEIAPEEEDEEF